MTASDLYVIVALSASLYDEGFKNITSIDTSEVVIMKMAEQFADKADMECKSICFHLQLRTDRHCSIVHEDD